jgi:hypothetical protein
MLSLILWISGEFEKGRYRRPKLLRDLRQCTVCTQIEDEEHFILFYFAKKTWFDQNLFFSKLNIDVTTLLNAKFGKKFNKIGGVRHPQSNRQ